MGSSRTFLISSSLNEYSLNEVMNLAKAQNKESPLSPLFSFPKLTQKSVNGLRVIAKDLLFLPFPPFPHFHQVLMDIL